MPDLTKQQKLIAVRALVTEARSIWESIGYDVMHDTYTEDRAAQFDDAGNAMCDIGAVGRTIRAILKEY